jgi:hypothetical protein
LQASTTAHTAYFFKKHMSLRIEKHPEIDRISEYFRKVEELAKRMGVDIDDLAQNRPVGSLTIHVPTRDQQQRLARERANVFVGESPAPTVVREMSVLFAQSPDAEDC